MKKLAIFCFIVATFLQNGFSQTPDLYLGLTPPGNIPEIFAPEIVSLSTRNERVITFSPSGHEIFFAIGDWPTPSVMYIQYQNGMWTSPVTASFSTNRPVGEPFFSLDGSRVYYFALPTGSANNADIYYSEKIANSWDIPVSVGNVINSAYDEFHPCIVNDGSLYFTDRLGKAFRSQFSNGNFQNAIALPNNVNCGAGIWGDHFVSPDESFLIYHSPKAGGNRGYDLYISFKNVDGSWTNPQNFGNIINSSGNEISPDLTPDGKYMTFGRDGDIYWVAIENTIAELKATSGVVLSVKTGLINKNIKIYPNPTKGFFNICFGNSNCEKAIAEISNIEGKIISKNIITTNSVINLSNESKGTYFVKLSFENQIIIKNICLQ